MKKALDYYIYNMDNFIRNLIYSGSSYLDSNIKDKKIKLF